jgi:homoserine acetyltransferase
MISSTSYNSNGILFYFIPSFRFNAGCSLPVRIAYRSFNPTSSKAVLVPTSEHGRINTTNNFTSGALKGYHVVVAMFGNGESSSSSNTDNFPQPLYQDCVNASYDLFTKHLNIYELEAIVGYGMGGQQAYYWTRTYPGFVNNAVIICGSVRICPFNYMLLDGITAALVNSARYAKENSEQQDTEPGTCLHGYGRMTCAWSTNPAWFKEEFFLEFYWGSTP